ncbi:unnamed protein product [Prunus armeniaca]
MPKTPKKRVTLLVMIGRWDWASVLRVEITLELSAKIDSSLGQSDRSPTMLLPPCDFLSFLVAHLLQPLWFLLLFRIYDEPTSVVSTLITASGGWDVPRLYSIFTFLEAEIILTIPLTNCNLDRRMWHYTANGRYTVKNGYWLAIEIKRTKNSSLISVGAPPHLLSCGTCGS